MKIYRDARVEKEQCNFGCLHNVTYNEVAIVEEVLRVKKQLFYGPTPCGTGYDIFYRDILNGDLFIREADWSGTSNVLVDADHRFWMTRPQGHEVNRNISGELIPR